MKQIWLKYQTNIKSTSLELCIQKKSARQQWKGNNNEETTVPFNFNPSPLWGEASSEQLPLLTWTTVVPPRGSTNPRQPLLAIDLSLQFSGSSIPKQKLLTRFSLAASILYNLIRACAQNIEDDVWNFNEHTNHLTVVATFALIFCQVHVWLTLIATPQFDLLLLLPKQKSQPGTIRC